MTNLKKIIEEHKLEEQFGVTSMDLLVQALEEAIDIIFTKDFEDRKAYGNYYESKDLQAKEWLNKWGF